MPPWLQEIRDNFLSLHSKADRQHQDILTVGAEVQTQGVRIGHLEQVASEHTLKHEDTEACLKALEKCVKMIEMLKFKPLNVRSLNSKKEDFLIRGKDRLKELV